MTQYNIAIEAAERLVDFSHDFDQKPTKEISKKMRDLLNRLRKVAHHAREELIKNDKTLEA